MTSAELQDRVRARVRVEDRGYRTACWISTRARHTRGYTKIGVGGRTELTHRAAYMAFRGPIPDGLVVDHLCRVRVWLQPGPPRDRHAPREPRSG